jgi:hypothetical protein
VPIRSEAHAQPIRAGIHFEAYIISSHFSDCLPEPCTECGEAFCNRNRRRGAVRYREHLIAFRRRNGELLCQFHFASKSSVVLLGNNAGSSASCGKSGVSSLLRIHPFGIDQPRGYNCFFICHGRSSDSSFTEVAPCVPQGLQQALNVL